MSNYQSFPNNPGSADSMGKLANLLLPPLVGKSFLDVGCNQGFFCGYASFDAASKIVGIDIDQSSLNKARERFPYCDFRYGDWEHIDTILKHEEKFDVILMASALHYAKNQQMLIEKLMKRLSPSGTLVLEIGIVESMNGIDAIQVSPGWYDVKRSIDTCKFADWQGVRELLSPYAYKHAGKSVAQIGDPLPRHVFHIQNVQPTAILMTGDPASGKSTLAKTLGRAVTVIKGDFLLCQINAQPDRFASLTSTMEAFNPQRLDLAILRLCDNGGLNDYAQIVAERANGKDFIYDGYIPPEYEQKFAKLLAEKGFRICSLETQSPIFSQNTLSKRSRIEARKYQLFLSAMESANQMRKRLR